MFDKHSCLIITYNSLFSKVFKFYWQNFYGFTLLQQSWRSSWEGLIIPIFRRFGNLYFTYYGSFSSRSRFMLRLPECECLSKTVQFILWHSFILRLPIAIGCQNILFILNVPKMGIFRFQSFLIGYFRVER